MDSHVEDAERYVREAGDGPGTAIEAEGYQFAAHGIDFFASIAAGLDLQSTPRSEVVDGGSFVTISGDVHTSDAAATRQDRTNSCQYPPACGWKRRNQTGDRLTARAMPSKFTSIERCLLNSEGKHAPDTFAPIVGSSFDSCQ